jgi:hypothetical protein
MQDYKFLLTSIVMVLCYSCSDIQTSPKTIEQKAIRIANRLDNSSIHIFHEWNYVSRGKTEIWYKEAQDTMWYNCVYVPFPDTMKLYINGNTQKFLIDYPLDFPIESLKYSRIDILKSTDNYIQIIASYNGKRIVIKSKIREQDVFKISNPIEEIHKLSKLKDSLEIVGIHSNKDLGNFNQYYLSSEDILTYLPDDLVLDPQFKDVWLKKFATGKIIKKNWNLRKLSHPIDSE